MDELRAVIIVLPPGKESAWREKGGGEKERSSQLASAKRERHLWSAARTPSAAGSVPRACRESTKICSYEVQVQVQVVPRADLRHFKQLGTKPGGNGGGGRSHQLRNSAFVRDRDGGQGREGRAES